MQTRAYSICRRCAAVYPEGRRCPVCEGDTKAAQEVHDATMFALEAARMSRRKMSSGTLVVTSVLAVTLVASLGMLLLALV